MDDKQPIYNQDTEDIPEIDNTGDSIPLHSAEWHEIFAKSTPIDHVTSEKETPITANLTLSKHVDYLLTTFLIICVVCACMMAILIVIFINKAMAL